MDVSFLYKVSTCPQFYYVICCERCGIGMADIVIGCYACLIVHCDGMLKLNGTGNCET